METIELTMQSWHDGLLSDVEALTRLCLHLSSSPVSDAIIEIVGKMDEEEKAEWEAQAEEATGLADMIHGPKDLDDFEPNR